MTHVISEIRASKRRAFWIAAIYDSDSLRVRHLRNVFNGILIAKLEEPPLNWSELTTVLAVNSSCRLITIFDSKVLTSFQICSRYCSPTRPHREAVDILLNKYGRRGLLSRVAVLSAKNHKRQRRKRQPVTAKREKSQTPKVLTAILT